MQIPTVQEQHGQFLEKAPSEAGRRKKENLPDHRRSYYDDISKVR
jgi:hypothetical protein